MFKICGLALLCFIQGLVAGPLPDSFDWRFQGGVGPVGNEGSCGAGYGFAATGALETQVFRKTGKLPDFSEQELVDCSSKYGNQGCGGGTVQIAFQYIIRNGGISSEKDYPYVGNMGSCRSEPNVKYATKVKRYVTQPIRYLNELKEMVATKGTVAVLLDTSAPTFSQYKGGLYECGGEPKRPTTAFLLVGYGVVNGQDYWILKSSWGKAWGEKGYIRIVRNKGGDCGIGFSATYPVLG